MLRASPVQDRWVRKDPGVQVQTRLRLRESMSALTSAPTRVASATLNQPTLSSALPKLPRIPELRHRAWPSGRTPESRPHVCDDVSSRFV
jgi:hypothetical protein